MSNSTCPLCGHDNSDVQYSTPYTEREAYLLDVRCIECEDCAYVFPYQQ